MRTAIVDDEWQCRVQIAAIVKDFFCRRGEEEPVHIFKNGIRLLDALDQGDEYDVYFLDVAMDGIDGLELARQIRERQRWAFIVFITSHREAALPSYQIHCCYFIEKNQVGKELPELLHERWERWKKEQAIEEEKYYIISGPESRRISVKDILYLTKEKKDTVFHCRGGKVYRERTAQKEVLECLPKESFFLIDKGIAIQIEHLTEIRKQDIELQDGTERICLTVSRRRLAGIKDLFNQRWRKE